MESKPFLMRMRDDVRVLLDGASKEQRRSRASIIEQLIRENLKQFEPTDNRLNRMLSNDGQN
jgi:metal-responsive CopG/Arc/MetJ family transcriptional regulator